MTQEVVDNQVTLADILDAKIAQKLAQRCQEILLLAHRLAQGHEQTHGDVHQTHGEDRFVVRPDDSITETALSLLVTGELIYPRITGQTYSLTIGGGKVAQRLAQLAMQEVKLPRHFLHFGFHSDELQALIQSLPPDHPSLPLLREASSLWPQQSDSSGEIGDRCWPTS